LNETIKRVTSDISGRFNFNTAISAIMELVNEMYRYNKLKEINVPLMRHTITELVTMLAPFTPHICEEMWCELGHQESLVKISWPECDESALVKEEITIIVQINGKLKERLSVASGLSREELGETVLQNEAVKQLLADKNVVKTSVVPGKLVNFVVK
jgi:leucyl-tRNA synthetase